MYDMAVVDRWPTFQRQLQRQRLHLRNNTIDDEEDNDTDKVVASDKVTIIPTISAGCRGGGTVFPFFAQLIPEVYDDTEQTQQQQENENEKEETGYQEKKQTTQRVKSLVSALSLALLGTIRRKQQYLEKITPAYMNRAPETAVQQMEHEMTEAERDDIDSQTWAFIQSLSQEIKSLQTVFQRMEAEYHNAEDVPQALRHYQQIVAQLFEELQTVTETFEQLQAYRYKQKLQRYQKEKKQNRQHLFPKTAIQEASSWISRAVSNTLPGGKLIDDDEQPEHTSEVGSPPATQMSASAADISTVEHANRNHQPSVETMQIEASPDTSQTQEQLQVQPAAEMEWKTRAEKEYEMVEARMKEISSLMKTFTEKILEQQETVTQVYEDTTKSRTSVQSGNAELHSAITHGKSFRKFVFLLLILGSLLLLAFDYYNTK